MPLIYKSKNVWTQINCFFVYGVHSPCLELIVFVQTSDSMFPHTGPQMQLSFTEKLCVVA